MTATKPPAAHELDASRMSHLVGYAASRAAITLRQVFAKHMAPLDLKIVEFSILMLVAQNHQVNQKQLGQALDISAPNMAVTLDRMVERGWVLRERCSDDRRSQRIALTLAGRKLTARAEKIAETMEDDAMQALSPRERATLIRLLMRVATGAG
jgi:DNA-binding MarR family transcriptional regulator